MRGLRRSVMVLSDHVLLREGVACLLRDHGLNVGEQGADAPIRATRWDVAIVDLDHTRADTVTLVRQVQDRLADSYLIVVGTPARLAAAVNGAAHAELETSRADETALIAATNRRPPPASPELARMHRLWAEVTARQRDVLRWLSNGLDNPGIAMKLRIGPRAVKAHVSALLALFGFDTRAELALLAREAGLRPPTGR